MTIPKGKVAILSSLVERKGSLYNCCELLPTQEWQAKVHLDQREAEAGIVAGQRHRVFESCQKRFKVLICTDFRFEECVVTEGLDFLVWVSHFNRETYKRAAEGIERFVRRAGIPLFASSLASDQNNGHSTYADVDRVVSLSHHEAILEVCLSGGCS